MSRLDGRPLVVEQDDQGMPTGFTLRDERSFLPIMAHIEHFREWIGVLDGQPERDIWHVETIRGCCELHHLRQPTGQDDEPCGEWILIRWDD